jgi:hypothetical protein
MSHRIRNSTARPTPSRHSVAATPSRNAATDELPPYKKPSHPLDGDAARQLRELQGRSLNDVKRHNKQATETITSTAESINDMLREQSEYIARRQKKWDAGKSLDDKEDEERAMEELKEQIEEATAKLEESMRAVIDSGIAAQRIDDTLDWLRQHAPRQLEDEYQSQMTQRATQRQQRRTQDADGDEDMSDAEELDEGPTPGPTPLDNSRITLTGVSELFTDRQQRQKDTYTSLSLTTRYARNNDYRDFKRIVHDAKYGDAGPTLGHEDTWFTESGSPAPGITDTQRGDFDDDDDIIMDKATISTRCPITFQQFKEPYTSTKCPHTFERNAIVDMIRTSPITAGTGGPRGGGMRSVRCPVTGCDQVSSLVCRGFGSFSITCHLLTVFTRTSLSTTSALTPFSSARSSACNSRKLLKQKRVQMKKQSRHLVGVQDRSMEAIHQGCRFPLHSSHPDLASSRTWVIRATMSQYLSSHPSGL